MSGLLGVALVGWLFLVESQRAMRSMQGEGAIMDLMGLMMAPGKPVPYLLACGFMWIVMMIAMMIPALLPMAATFRQLDRGSTPSFDLLLFVIGYGLAWAGFSVLAAILQWGLHGNSLLRGMDLAAQGTLAAGIIIGAGIYQVTPFKEACLDRCRSPLGFFLAQWRPGRRGAVAMGLRHGLFCVGCCWALMLLMFVGGAMSVVTMALICAFVLAERLVPAGPWVAKLPGLAMIGGGAVLLWTT